MAFIHIENLTFQYALAEKPALSKVNLSIEEGEFLLLCGTSGCGKTTLLRHLKRELTPHGKRCGSISFASRPLSSLSALESACGAGFVMQDPDSQIVTDVVWHELAFGLENIGTDPGTIRRRVAEMASFFGISSWLHKSTTALSGGQKQMLNLASILCMRPRLLLLDEPTAMLDPVASREFVEMVSRLNREFGITVVMSAHRLEDVFHLADRVAFLQGGSIRYLAPPAAFGGLLENDADALAFMPACVRIFSAVEGHAGEDCPLTVLEGRRYLAEKLQGLPARVSCAAASPRGEKAKRTPALEAHEVWYRYEKAGNDILKGLSLRAFSGEITCILGENGAGKSTLLQLLAGLVKPQAGWVRAEGRPLTRLSARELYRRNLAFLPQNPKPLFACDRLEDDLLAAEGSAGSEGLMQALAARLSLTPLLGRHPYDLSGGEMQRAALCKLLLTWPKTLLLDEPTSSLDVAARADLAALFRELKQKGMCILIITHDIEFAAENADDCQLLFDGKIACGGGPRAFFGGNTFYTTAANRMARDFEPGAITCEDVIALCQNTGR